MPALCWAHSAHLCHLPYGCMLLSLRPLTDLPPAPHRTQVIRGGESVKFTVSFTSHRSVPHNGYLLGEQKVFSPEMPISLKVRQRSTQLVVG